MRDILKLLKTKDENIGMGDKQIGQLEKTIQKLQTEKDTLQIQLEEALKGKNQILTMMEKRFSKAQIDRILYDKRTSWSSDDFAAAILMLGVSSDGYNYMRNHYEYPLPCVTVVKKHLANLTFEPGMLKQVLTLMEYVSSSLTKMEKFIVISYDEMYVDSRCCYDEKQDQVYGPCKQVQVVNVRSLFGKWKNPIFFQFDCRITKDIYNNLAKALHSAGYYLIANVCDSHLSNKTFYKSMGVTVNAPFFIHPITKKICICLHDPPHLCKLCRNHLLDPGIRLNPGEKPERIASKDPLLELVTLSTGVDLLTHKLKIGHLTVKGSERQNVLKAAQVLSESTAKALLYAGEKGFLKSKNFEV